MSASLVGSEMCIRDRSVRVATVLGAARNHTQLPSATNINCCERLYFPVSYTHLTLPTICSV
eukprot:86714-Alexandrium_andersonii.AAC.1